MKKLILIFLVVLFCSSPALAVPFGIITFDTNTLYDVGYTYTSNNGSDVESSGSTSAGLLQLSVYDSDGQSTPGEFQFNTDVFCIDLFTPIFQNDSEFFSWYTPSTYDTPDDYSNYDLYQAAWLIDEYWSSGNSNLENAALQLAIWKALYNDDNGYDITFSATGNSINTNLLSQYNTYWSSLGSNFSLGNDLLVVDFQPDDYQDFITTTPVPEPATMLLMGTGLLGLAGVGSRRKRARKNRM